jgi:hypothetical protein
MPGHGEALVRQNRRSLCVCLDFSLLLSLHQGKESKKAKCRGMQTILLALNKSQRKFLFEPFCLHKKVPKKCPADNVQPIRGQLPLNFYTTVHRQ